MLLVPKASVDTLISFTKLVSEVSAPREVLPLLAEAAVRDFGVEGAAVFEIAEKTGGMRFVASQNLPNSLSTINAEPGLVGRDFTDELLKACPGLFTHAHTLPLISDKNLYGMLVVFFKEKAAPSEDQIAILEALVQLAAIAQGKVDQYSKLRKAYKDLQRSQETLAQTEKLRALGQMSAGISHDIRNLLAPLTTSVELLKQMTDKAAPSMKIVELLERCLRRGVETLERLRVFSRQTPEEKNSEGADLNHLAQEAIEVCRPRLGRGLEIKTTLCEKLPPVCLRPADCVSAMVNILFNAIDALDGQGVIEIQSGESNDGAWIEISDNGPGMPDEVKARMFEPFFTTKGKKGTGLGLAMVYAFVQRSSGHITLNTAPGKGTSFKLWFPVTAESCQRMDDLAISSL
ncbi:MAG: GAF domain-containing sensor histidine kinase [bacterium]|nr:GAF domain-containing sensor histidine kinase [bacterium]